MYLVLTWIVMALLTVLASYLLLRMRSATYRQRLVAPFWRKVGLPMATDEMAAAVSRRIGSSPSRTSSRWTSGARPRRPR